MPFAPVVRQVTIQTKAHKVVNRAVNVFEDSFGIFQHPLRDLGATCSGHCAQEGHQKNKNKKREEKKRRTRLQLFMRRWKISLR